MDSPNGRVLASRHPLSRSALDMSCRVPAVPGTERVYRGVAWGWVAMTTHSIVLTSVAHILFHFSGLGGRIYLRASPKT